MSATVSYRPVNPYNYTSVDGQGSFARSLIECFGEFPIILNRNHIDNLLGIAACGLHGANELIHAINIYKEIEVIVSY